MYYDKNSFKNIITDIIDRGYDMNYASILASDYIFEENPDIEFSVEFSDSYGVVMDFFLNAKTKVSNYEFRRVLDDLHKIVNVEVSQENLISILYENEIKKYGDLHKAGKISYHVFRDQIDKLSNQDLDTDQIIQEYIIKNDPS